MLKRKITVNKKSKNWQDRYPMVSVTWRDIISDSQWQSIDSLMKLHGFNTIKVVPMLINKSAYFWNMPFSFFFFQHSSI